MTRPHLDYDEILRIVEPGSSVLDLGCGDGRLLQRLRSERGVRGRGIDIGEEMIMECVNKGISVLQGDLNEGLEDYQSGSYDYVILNQTLQVTLRPTTVIKEMLRVGQRAIVSFPNFGNWRIRRQLLVSGRMPVTRDLPFRWYNTPNIHMCTRTDFVEYCARRGIRILREIAIAHGRRITLRWVNLRATEVIFILEGAPPVSPQDPA